jgi:hypothetical protein
MVDIAAIAGSVIAALGLMGVFIKGIDRRGRDKQAMTDNQQSLASSIDDLKVSLKETGERQSVAIDNLAAQVGGLNVTLTEHHFRIKALEDKQVRVIVK